MSDDRFDLRVVHPEWSGRKAVHLEEPLLLGLRKLYKTAEAAQFLIVEHIAHWDYDGPIERISSIIPCHTFDETIACLNEMVRSTREAYLIRYPQWHDLPSPADIYYSFSTYGKHDLRSPKPIRSFALGSPKRLEELQARYFCIDRSDGDLAEQLLSYSIFEAELISYLIK